MAIVPCPRCDEPLDLDGDGCAHCRAKRWNTLRPLFVAVGWIIAAAAAIVLWEHQALETAWTDFSQEVERTRNPHMRTVADMAPPPVAAPPVSAASASVSTTSFVYLETPNRAPIFMPAPAVKASPAAPTRRAPENLVENATEPPPPALPDETVRRFYGVVYNVLTLEPVANAKLEFKMKGQSFGWKATTNTHGHYQIDLFTGALKNKVSVSVTAIPGYRDGLIEDKDPPLREQPLSRRRRFAEETTPFDLEDTEVPTPAGDPRIVPFDLVLLPVASTK